MTYNVFGGMLNLAQSMLSAWIDSAFTVHGMGPISLCVDLFAFICVYFVFLFYTA